MERTAGTFQDRLVTELRLAGASSIGEANRVLEQFLPRFNQRLPGSPATPEPAIPAPGPGPPSGTGLGFKHTRRVARDNTVRFQLHTRLLLPELECPSYAGAAVEVLEGLDGRLTVRMRDASLLPGRRRPLRYFSRNGNAHSASVPVPPSGADSLGEHWRATLEALDSRAEDDEHPVEIADSAAPADKPKAASARQPTFLQRGRWKAIQKARRKGKSLRTIERELESPGPHPEIPGWRRSPARQSQAVPTASSSHTMAA